MKTYFVVLTLLALFLFSSKSHSQLYLISQGGTVTTCSGDFFDSGGLIGNYSNNEDFTITFLPATSGAKLQFVFNSFVLESQPNCNKDYLRIYDGVDISAPLIDEYCGTTSLGTIIATNTTGALTFVFHSNNNRTFAGWSATISCSIPPNLGLWTGTLSSDWNTNLNWYNSQIPNSTTNVTIPSAAPNWPTFNGNIILGSTCNNITMDGSSEFTVTGNLSISAGNSLTCNANSIIYIGGNLAKSGTFNVGTSTVDFYGSSNSIITGSGGSWTVFEDGFETDKGWVLTGEFERTQPQGLGGGNGQNNPDPSSAFNGGNVIGVDLTGLGSYPGNYESNLVNRAYQAVSPTFDFTGYTNVSFSFQRWLGVQNFNQDKAYIDLSVDNGSTWNQIWANPGAISETSWSLQTFNIPSSDNQSQVKIRFCIGTTNQNQQYCGWNIDDFQVTADVWSQVTFYNLTVSKTNAEVISVAHISVLNNLDIESDAYFTNSTGRAMGVEGNASFEANTTGMASYIDNGTTLVDGNINVQQYLTSERWHLISSPITNATINSYFDIYLKFYNEPTDTWTYLVEPTTIPINVGQGYSAWASNYYTGTTTVSFETSDGELNNNNYYIDTLVYTPSSPNEGFNLLGNPYPCALDWNSNWNMTNLSGWMMIYDNGVYRGYHTDGTSYNGGTSIIPSTQGFWIRTLGSIANITIPKSQRVHSAQAFYKETKEIIHPVITLESEINRFSDEATVIFHPECTPGFDGYYDLTKFMNIEEAPTLYTITGGKNYAMNFYEEEYLDVVVPVGFETRVDGIYNVAASNIANFDDAINVYLEDIKEGIVTNLSADPIYEFDHNLDNDPHRFNLHFKESWYGVEDNISGNINIYSANDYVYILTPEMQSGDVFIYDMLGQEILNQKISESGMTKIRVTSGSAYYLVKFQSDKIFITEKVFIK